MGTLFSFDQHELHMSHPHPPAHSHTHPHPPTHTHRDALRHAYEVLETSEQGIKFHDFLLFMQQYKPRTRETQCLSQISSSFSPHGQLYVTRPLATFPQPDTCGQLSSTRPSWLLIFDQIPSHITYPQLVFTIDQIPC